MRRQLRKLAGRYLRPFAPNHFLVWWAKRLYGFRRSRAELAVTNDHEAGTLMVGCENGYVSIRLVEAQRNGWTEWLKQDGRTCEEWFALIREGQSHRTLFDLGSYDGVEAVLFCLLHPHNTAVMFEPSPHPLRGLNKTLNGNRVADRVTVRQVALGCHHEMGRMVLGSGGMFEILEELAVSQDAEPIVVDFRRLDDECWRMDRYPDLIRMDVDACELDVLRGARGVLERCHPTIIMELHLDLLERRGQSAREVCELLQSMGYSFYSCLNKPLRPAQIYDSANAVLTLVARWNG